MYCLIIIASATLTMPSLFASPGNREDVGVGVFVGFGVGVLVGLGVGVGDGVGVGVLLLPPDDFFGISE